MRATCVPILLALIAPIAAAKALTKTANENDLLALYDKIQELQDGQQHGRELIFDSFCASLLSGLIGGIGSLVGANITCDCGLELIPPGISVGCGSSAPVCFVPPDIVCGVPSLDFSLDILSIFAGGFPFGAEICYDNLMIGGVLDLSFIPFCLSLSPSILSIFGLSDADAQAGNYTIDSIDKTCDAKIGEDACLSCDVCSSNTVSFNCTNIHPVMVATCVDIGVIPTSFSDVVRVDEVKFKVDSLP